MPEIRGLNVIVNGTLWPAGMVTGREIPPIAKAELLDVAPVTVTLSPLAPNLPDAVPLAPTSTFPNPRVVGVTLSWPVVTVFVPLPDNGIVSEGSDPFEVMMTPPVALPSACGAKVTLNVTLWEAVKVAGAVIPLI